MPWHFQTYSDHNLSKKDLSDSDQAEEIASKFAEISQLYNPVDRNQIDFPVIEEKDVLKICNDEVLQAIKDLKPNKSVRTTDIPPKIYKHFASILCKPITGIINKAIRDGVWPDLLKTEMITPVPKVSQPKSTDDLRPIAGLMTLNKVFEKVICKYVTDDMKQHLDPGQFGNQKGQGTNHYLVKLIHRILSALEEGGSRGEPTAVLIHLVDLSKAFSRQDNTLTIKSFQRNGVRDCLIPILTSFFENRRMIVKWRGLMSEMKSLPGGAAMGSSLGVYSFMSQSNSIGNTVPVDDRYKFVDDMTIMEKISLVNVGLATYNVKSHVPSHIADHNQIIPSEHLKSQQYMEDIKMWTDENKMKLNEKKTKNMIFNFSTNKQFCTEIKVNGEVIETVNEARLLGTIISSDLKWEANTKYLVKDSNKRLRLLHNAYKFTRNKQHLKQIYMLQVRCKLEQAAPVWHHSLTKADSSSLERVQRAACRIIFGDNYKSYEDSLEVLKMDTLEKRRNKLTLSFAKSSLKLEKMKKLFPMNENNHGMVRRNVEKFKVIKAKTERFKSSAVVNIQRMLNHEEQESIKVYKQVVSNVLRTCDSLEPISLRKFT